MSADIPKGNYEDAYNDEVGATCEAFISAIKSVMSHLDGEQATRDSAVDTAKEDFSGYFSELFDQNTTIQKEDKCQLYNTLEVLKTGMEEAKEAAKAEQDRRKKAREWAEEHEAWKKREENFLGQLWNGLFSSEPEIDTSELEIPDPPKIKSPDAVTISEHTTPSPREATDRMSKTSSAVPDYLNTFVTTCSGLDKDLEELIDSLDGKWREMEGAWLWGKEDTGGSASTFVLIGGMEEFIGVLKQYNEANRNDAKWINVIKEAFEEAGSQGQGGVRTLSNQALYGYLQNNGVTADRDNLEIPELSLAGLVPTSGYTADPVNVANGNFVEPETDLVFDTSATGSTLNLTRTYNSIIVLQQHHLTPGQDTNEEQETFSVSPVSHSVDQTAANNSQTAPGGRATTGLDGGELSVGCFGVGWTSVLDQRLLFTKDGACWINETGRRIYFPDPTGSPTTSSATSASGSVNNTSATDPGSSSSTLDNSESDISSELVNALGGVECVGGGFWLQQVSLADFEFLSAPVPKEIETIGTVFPPTITTATTSDAASADSSPTAHTDTSSKASTSGASNADSDVLVDAVHDAATVGTNSLGWRWSLITRVASGYF